MESDSEEEKCCGNGCNTCVLDKKKVIKDGSLIDNVIDSRYQWFRVSDIKQEARNVFTFEFQYCDESDSEKGLFIPHGAHLMLRVPSEDILKDVNEVFVKAELESNLRKRWNQEPKKTITNDPDMTKSYTSRPYSPYQFHPVDRTFRILFRYEGGEMSKRMIRLKIGDLVEFKGFYSGEFIYSRNMTRTLICICQGVAIAPMINVIQQILQDEEDDTIINLFACFRDFHDILLKDTLREMMNYWNFKLNLYLPYHIEDTCKQKSISCCDCIKKHKLFTETVYLQRINSETMKPNPDAIYLISGSEDFITSTSGLLKDLQIVQGKIFQL